MTCLCGPATGSERSPNWPVGPSGRSGGHHLAHACHATRDTQDELVSVGLLYGLCLHSGLQRALAPVQGDGGRHHEFPVFQQHLPRWLAQDRGTRVPIIVGDPADIDVRHWSEQKRLRQAHLITREKENRKPTSLARHRFDPADPVNRGVEADEMAGYTHAALRRLVYRDPASGERFVFLPTVENLRPGLSALLYLLRWKIEKTFDVFKNKLHQQRAWANGPVAAHTHAHFCAFTHHLLTILLATLELADLRVEKNHRSAAGPPCRPPRRPTRVGPGNGPSCHPAHLPVHSRPAPWSPRSNALA